MGLLAFLIPLTTYLLALAPGIVASGDSAELTVTAWQLGIAHPPGYPLYNLLGHAFIKIIPCSTVAFRMNLFSAFFAALTAIFIFFTVKRLTKSSPTALFSAFVFSFLPLVFKYSIIAEVFALNSFFAALLSYLAVCWYKNRETRFFIIFCFIFGLSLTHHQTMLLIFPATLLFFLPQFKKPGSLLAGFLLFLLGLSVLLYLPLRAQAGPEINWIGANTPEGFKKLVFRTIYGKPTFEFSQLSTLTNSPFYDYLRTLLFSFFFVGTLVGLYGLLKQLKSGLTFFATAFLFTGPFFILFLKFDGNPIFFDISRRFYPLSFVFFAIAAGFGLYVLLEKIKIRPSLYAILPALTLILPVVNYNSVSQAGNNFLENFCKAALYSTGEKKALVIVTGDSTIMGFDYLQMVEQKRREIRVFSLEKLSHKWYVDKAKALYPEVIFPFERLAVNETLENFRAVNSPTFEMHLLGITKERLGPSLKPVALVIGSRAEPVSARNGFLLDEVAHIEDRVSLLNFGKRTPEADFQRELFDYTVKSYTATGYEAHTANNYKLAIYFYNKALALDPTYYGTSKNLGVLCYTTGRMSEAKEAFTNFLKYAPSDEPDRVTIQNLVSQQH